MKKPRPLSTAALALPLIAALGCLSTGNGRADEALSRSLTHFVSFDKGFTADFSKGDKTCYLKKGAELVPCQESDEVKLAPDAGRFGGAVWFPKKGATRPLWLGQNVLGYNDKSWSTTVSLWLRLTPDEDLEPGYCDPVQIVGDDTKKGFIFLEWSKDHNPRHFRYAIRPLIELWDPQGLGWEGIPDEKRPMVRVLNAPFSRERWTHAVFTLDRINDKAAPPSGTLYLDGKKQGRIDGHDLTFGWDPASVSLVIGAAYVGHQDDLAVFDRVLTDDEVTRLFQLKGGVRELIPADKP
ncbi:MAG: hypothetical protein JNK37_18485 [Verrucomicrobiales bacterium]|nr:hypothetical protein [Verrucomicrobiales bacterium]